MKQIEDVLKVSEQMDEVLTVEPDKMLLVDGWELYEKVADKNLDRYLSRFRVSVLFCCEFFIKLRTFYLLY